MSIDPTLGPPIEAGEAAPDTRPLRNGEHVLVMPTRKDEKPWTGRLTEEGHIGALVQVVADEGNASVWMEPDRLYGRGRSDVYIAVADKLPRKPGTCPRDGCGEALIGFVAGDIAWTGNEAITATIGAWFRFGCPVHDIHVGEHEGLASLRHESDPIWTWAPSAWRPALARVGWGLPPIAPRPRVLVGEYDGRVWVTDARTLIIMPAGTTLAEVEDGIGSTVVSGNAEQSARATAEYRTRYRLRHDQIADKLDLSGYAWAPEPQAPSAIGWPEKLDVHHLALGTSIVPKDILEMVSAFYPGARWAVRGPLDPVHLVEPDRARIFRGFTVAVMMPVNPVANGHERRVKAEGPPA